MKDTMVECVRSGGRILLEHFGRVRDIRVKENQSSVVTEADLASEHHILKLIRARFPGHNIVAEETGCTEAGSPYTWVVDPLDGTSNFAAGLPWFGVMVSVLERGDPILAAMYLPLEDRLYLAERGAGATRNGEPVRVSSELDLSRTLCACGMDPSGDAERVIQQARLLASLVQRARNFRATNSLVDFACTIDGRLGACVNHHTMIWDIAAPALLLREAGGRLADLAGREITLRIDADCARRGYAVVGGSPVLVQQVLELVASSGLA